MRNYLINRTVSSIALIVSVVVVNFLLTRIIPGNPLEALIGDFPVPPEYLEEVRAKLGFDQPLYVQLWLYLVELAKGNLGFSFVNRQEVLHLIIGRAGATLVLMIPALILSSVIGVLLSVWTVQNGSRTASTLLTSSSVVGASIPVFWLAQVMIMFFAVRLGWLPAQGMQSVRESYTGFASLVDILAHIAMPVFCLTIYYMAKVSRVSYFSMLEMSDQDFVLTAKAKGLTPPEVMWRHVLRNSLIPVITVIGYNFGTSLTGAILTEAVFAWPGLGNLFVSSIAYRDYPVLSGIFLISATLVVVCNLFTDMLYAAVDPRVRSSTYVRS